MSRRPEFTTPQDGHDKQDCEQQAIKRWVKRNAERFELWQVTAMADDLHSHQPPCELLAENKMHFIMTCKEESHQALYQEVELLTRHRRLAGGIEQRQAKGPRHRLEISGGGLALYQRFRSSMPARVPPQTIVRKALANTLPSTSGAASTISWPSSWHNLTVSSRSWTHGRPIIFLIKKGTPRNGEPLGRSRAEIKARLQARHADHHQLVEHLRLPDPVAHLV